LLLTVSLNNYHRLKKVYQSHRVTRRYDYLAKSGVILTVKPELNLSLKDFLKLLYDTKLMHIPIINESEAADTSIVWLADFPKEVPKLQESIQN
jgi:hypothetical protein